MPVLTKRYASPRGQINWGLVAVYSCAAKPRDEFLVLQEDTDRELKKEVSTVFARGEGWQDRELFT